MAEVYLSNLVSKLLESLAKPALQEAASQLGVLDDLKKLEKKLGLIQSVVLDAVRYHEHVGCEAINEWLRRLRQLLNQADDLFDAILTVDRPKRWIQVNKLVRVSFSGLSSLCSNWKMAREIKSSRKQLDVMISDWLELISGVHSLGPQPLWPQYTMKRETGSIVRAEDVIGRKNDKKMIIEMLLDSQYDGERITVIPIVGLVGLGKTTLAQLVFNDEAVLKHFDLTKWVSVPDLDNPEAVVRNIYNPSIVEKAKCSSLDYIISAICGLFDKKYLLVLDNIWDDCRDSLLHLLRVLEFGQTGSRVIVTTRSLAVAKAVGTVKAYKLGFLTEEESWNLFKRSASFQEESNPSLTRIGKEIVDCCGNLPLAIRQAGLILRTTRSEGEWALFRDTEAKCGKIGNLMDVLKLSYVYLPLASKQCFAYCSLFPKEYNFSKNELINLWMAQGCFEPSNYDIGDKYFLNLLEMDFFQPIKFDDEGNVELCKMHVLVHHLAQYLSESLQISDNHDEWRALQLSVCWKENSFTVIPEQNYAPRIALKTFNLNPVFLKTKSLRALSLKNMGIDTIPDSIGSLLHLRYLNLAGNFIKSVPDAIIRLKNLQTLNLDDCRNLKELPRDFAKLDNLCSLKIDLFNLTDYPSGFGRMTSLIELNGFIVGRRDNNGVDSLPAINLRGALKIIFHKWRSDAVSEAKKANLKDNQQLSSLSLDLRSEDGESTAAPGEMEDMLTCLQLPSSLTKLKVKFYKGDGLPPRWFDVLSKIVSIDISWCQNCRVLPRLSQLPHLQALTLRALEAVEYIEDGGGGGNSSSLTHNDKCYYPSLEMLELVDLPQLKWWTRSSVPEAEDTDTQMNMMHQYQSFRLFFPQGLQLKIHGCPNLKSMPLAPRMKSLKAGKIHWASLKSLLTSREEAPSSSVSSSLPSSTNFTSLSKLEIWNMDDEPVALPISSSWCNLKILVIIWCKKLRSLMIGSQNSIRDLDIRYCNNLRDISSGLEHLSALVNLNITSCQELDLWDVNTGDQEEKSMTVWQGMRSLRSLVISDIWKLKRLPRGIAFINTLQSLSISYLNHLIELQEEIGHLHQLFQLQIRNCPKLMSVPHNLASLQKLYVKNCPYLAKRYKQPDGPDCHLLQHVLQVEICDE